MNSKSRNINICVLSFENIEIEYRVRNQVNFLSKTSKVDFIGFGSWRPPKNVTYIKLHKTKKTIFFYFIYITLLTIGRFFPDAYKFIFKIKSEYVEAKTQIQSNNYDILYANEWDALYISITACLNKQTKIIFDAHEFSPEQQNELFLWKTLVKPFRHWLFNKYLSKVDKVTTVSGSIAKLYEDNYKIKNVSVIYNTGHYLENNFRKTNPGCIKIIHHGVAIRNRSLENFITLSKFLDDRFVINLMLLPHDKGYYHFLKRLSNNVTNNKIDIIDFVDFSQINQTLLNYDIGFPAIYAANINNLFALGGKFFDYIMAGLAIAVPPFTAYKELVEEYEIGIVSEKMSIESLANKLNNTSSGEFDVFKKRSLLTAKQLNLEHENLKISNIINELFSS